MKNKLLSVSVSVLFTNLCLSLISSSDAPRDFIPFIRIITDKHLTIQPYDLFFVLLCFLTGHMYRYYGINLMSIKSLPHAFFPAKAQEVLMKALSGVLTHFILWPFLYQIFDPVISVIKDSPDSIRKIIIAMVAFSWILIIMIINRHGPVSQNTSIMPPPPNW